jgi:hypothetical protein
MPCLPLSKRSLGLSVLFSAAPLDTGRHGVIAWAMMIHSFWRHDLFSLRPYQFRIQMVRITGCRAYTLSTGFVIGWEVT